MKASRRAAALGALVVLLAAGILRATPPADQELLSRSRFAARSLRQALLRALSESLAGGGALAAVAVCREKAALLAEAASKENGVPVRRIRELYPGDRAVGFRAGELRGAFSVRVPLGPRGVRDETVTPSTQEGGSP